MNRRFISLLLAAALLLSVWLPGAAFSPELFSAHAEDWAEGKISFGVGVINSDSARNNWQYPRGGYTTWGQASWLSSIKVSLLDENQDILDSKASQGKMLDFEGLKEGSYYLRIEASEEKWVINEGRSDESATPWDMKKTVGPIEVGPAAAARDVKWVLEPRAYGLRLSTETGLFTSNGTRERVYFEGYNSTFQNEGNPAVFSTHNGIYYGDSPQQYSGMNSLEVPVLSDKEELLGYRFTGWQVPGEEEILTEHQALNHVVTQDLVFNAVFELPEHTIIFASNTDHGTIEGEGYKRFKMVGNQTIEDHEPLLDADDIYIPEVIPEDGYEFIGWYTDHTTNVVDEEDILGEMVISDLVYYAKFRKEDTGEEVDEEETATLIYVANGGRGHMDQYTGKPGDVVVASPVAFKMGGYTFDGWLDQRGRSIEDEGRVRLAEGINLLIAQWKQRSSGSSGGSGSGSGSGGSSGGTTVPSKLNGDDHFAYIVGYPDGTVRPNGSITRAEVATIFFRLLTEEARTKNLSTTNSFSDVSGGDWFNTAVSTLSRMGIAKGSGGTYRPNDRITRAEFAAMAARFDDNSGSKGAAFNDVAGHWAYSDLSKAAANGWINGYADGSFRPDQEITRAEAMAIVNRVLRRDPKSPEALLRTMNKWSDNSDITKWYYYDVQEATNSHEYERADKDSSEKWTRHRDTPDWTLYETGM